MARFRLLIEYEGTRYHGWQDNAGVKTIQGELVSACETLFNTKRVELYGAGRTDAGVHALGQVAHLEVPTQMYAENVADRLNEIIPYDIHILKAVSCDPDFHARHSAVARSYVYAISRRRSAFAKRYAWWVKEDLSVSKMKAAAALLKGFHDFSSFGAMSPDEKSTKVNVQHLEISESGNMVIIHIIGSHFLWMMVRRIIGVLVFAGKGKLSIKDINGFIQRHSERPAQLAAPASGLYLERVYYPGEAIQYKPQIPFQI
ncbi:MAG TPA: tRNA pseudouridine(38-40) synthase TruA [Bacteroidales bacterium]|nr:tRNA pseudouridine(38-40) synthase TruA [Bacteroidales bacterium]